MLHCYNFVHLRLTIKLLIVVTLNKFKSCVGNQLGGVVCTDDAMRSVATLIQVIENDQPETESEESVLLRVSFRSMSFKYNSDRQCHLNLECLRY